MVDMTLASSYLPAFSCLAKSLAVASMAHVFLPHGGLTALCVLLLLDRTFFNTEFIVDVNAVVAAVVACLAANHERAHNGMVTNATTPLAVVWVKLVMMQLGRPVFRARTEMCLYAALAVATSCTSNPIEPLSLVLGRTAAFVTLVLSHVYWHTATAHDEPLTLISARHAHVLLGTPIVAAAGCLGAAVLLAVRWHARPQQEVEVPSDIEAAALREALASRKEKSSQ